jgi:hypothetical protein
MDVAQQLLHVVDLARMRRACARYSSPSGRQADAPGRAVEQRHAQAASICARRLLTAGVVMPSSRAAAPRLPARASRLKEGHLGWMVAVAAAGCSLLNQVNNGMYFSPVLLPGAYSRDATAIHHPTEIPGMKTYTIACIPGDGIGKEVVPAGQPCCRRWPPQPPVQFRVQSFDWGGDYYRAHGVMMPADGLDALRHQDAILFGSAGDPTSPTTSRCGACA